MSSSPSSSSVVSVGDYAPSPNTCSQAVSRANQLRIQALLRELLQVVDDGGAQGQQRRIDTLRKLRKTMRELEYQLNWVTQVDFLESIERILREENETDTDWRLINDATQLLIEALPKLSFDLDYQTIKQVFPLVVQNLGHPRSEVRRASLLLINMLISERPKHFQQILKLFLEFGLNNQLNKEAQRGAVLSLPLLMTEQVVAGQDLSALIRSLSELLVDSNNSQLFYSLYLALQRLQLTIGDELFYRYLALCDREARILYEQAASRNNSVVQLPTNLSFKQQQQQQQRRKSSMVSQEARPEAQEEHAKQVTFEQDESPASEQLKRESQFGSLSLDDEGAVQDRGESFLASGSSSAGSSPRSSGLRKESPARAKEPKRANFEDLSSVSSTCSSEANLVEPSHYMSASALEGRPLSGFERIHHIDHSSTGLAINNINNSCSPTVEMGPNAQHELKFGIFPRHLVNVALSPAKNYLNRLEALEEMMCIIRESPINHLAILMTYFDSFLEQFLARLIVGAHSADYKLELVAIDMIETIVVKTKISTIQYIRPMVSLLIKTLADSRHIFRDNSVRVIHKMMAFLPPQHVIDAIFEHKHSKSVLIREESVNRITAAVLEYDKNEFNLTKLCYHVLPMLADQHSQVRLAALECIATLAQALGHERIGSLLTAAEAVQTGCDYDGLLDAINARLMRRCLPRANADGSISYHLKPYLASPGCSQEGADLRWVLEAPSRHQHAASGDNAQHGGPHHAHRPGAYSPPDVKRDGRRASVAPAALTVSLSHQHHPHHQPDSSDSDSKHHHHHHQRAAQNQRRQRAPDEGNEKLMAANCDACSKAPGSQQAGAQAERRRESNPAGQERPLEEVARADVGQGNRSEITQSNNRDGASQAGSRRRQSRGSGDASSRRSNSHESSSSASSSSDTNKLLFQFYLSKFRESLDAGRVNANKSDHSPGLPSDSIIYASDVSQLYAASRNQSRYQQTSFDYELGSVGRVAKQEVEVRPEERGEQQEQGERQSNTGGRHVESPKKLREVRKQSTGPDRRQLELQQQASLGSNSTARRSLQNDAMRRSYFETSSGSESPMTVMENFSSIEKQQLASQKRSSREEKLSREPSLGQERRKSSVGERRESKMVEEVAESVESAATGERRKSSLRRPQQQQQQEAPPEDGARELGRSPEPSRQRRQRTLQRSQATVDSPPSSALSKEDRQETSPQSRLNEFDLGSQGGKVEPGTASEDSAGQSSGEQAARSRRSSSRRRQKPLEANNDQDSMNGAADSIQGDSDRELHLVRRRASRSQPPTRSGSRLASNRQASSRNQINETNLAAKLSTPLTVTGGCLSGNEHKRSMSVSPSFAVNINIRHILETVAEVEGPFQEAPLALKVALNALDGPCWSTKVEGMLALIRLAAHHQALVVNHLHEIVYRLTQETKNLRSTVARSAIFTLGDYCERLKKSMETELDVTVQALLFKSMENTAFIRDDIRRALRQLCENLTQWKVATLLIQHGASHKNVHVRKMASQFVALLVERMGPAKCLVGARDISGQLLPATAKFAQDQSPHTRYYGRLILSKIMQHNAFERLMRKNLTPNLYRSTLGVMESVRRRGAGEPPPE